MTTSINVYTGPNNEVTRFYVNGGLTKKATDAGLPLSAAGKVAAIYRDQLIAFIEGNGLKKQAGKNGAYLSYRPTFKAGRGGTVVDSDALIQAGARIRDLERQVKNLTADLDVANKHAAALQAELNAVTDAIEDIEADALPPIVLDGTVADEIAALNAFYRTDPLA